MGQKVSLNQLNKLETHLRGTVGQVDQQRIFTAVESSFRHAFYEQKINLIQKLSMFNSKQSKILPASSSDSDSKNFILNLSKHVLSDSEETVLRKGLNFAVSKPHSNMDMV
jgi:hypothetical protein